MEEKDYFSMINAGCDGFSANGWADGYADLPSDHINLITQLYGKMPKSELANYLNEYLSGYELGKWMSENADEIYDEEGTVKSEYSLETISHYSEAQLLILEYKEELNNERI